MNVGSLPEPLQFLSKRRNRVLENVLFANMAKTMKGIQNWLALKQEEIV